MKRLFALFGSLFLVGVAIQILGPGAASADPVSTITLPDGNWDVTATVLSKSSGNDLGFGISSPTSSSICPTGLDTTCVGGESGTFPTLSGELVFSLSDFTCSDEFASTNVDHAHIDQADATHWQINWDDSGGPCGSPDGDFDDLVVSVEANGADMELTSKTVTSTSTPTATPNLVFANDTASQNTVEYTIGITNNGPIDALDVQVSDDLPEISTVEAFSSADYCVGTDAADCATNGFNSFGGTAVVGTVESSGSRVVIIRAHANSDLRGGPHTGVTNTATVSSSTGDPSPGNETGTSDAVEIDTVPNPPTIVQEAVGGNSSASVEFSNDGEVDGGQPITSYDVFACKTSNPSSCVAQTPAGPTPNATLNGNPIFSYIASGLNNGTQYSFSVAANNDVGAGDPVAAGDAYASAVAFTAFNATGTLTADLGFSGGAKTCQDPTAVNCKSIVSKYSFSDPNIGIAYNLDAEPLLVDFPCLQILSFDPTDTANYGAIGDGHECVADKIVRSTYPVPAANGTPHIEYDQLDASVTTLEHGAPCFELKIGTNGNPVFPLQCTSPAFPLFNDPDHPGHQTNFCPEGTGWTKAKPCAYIYYDVVRLPGFDISGNRPVPCSTSGCDAAMIVGSSVSAGINIDGGHQVPAWVQKRLTRVPSTLKFIWLNKKTGQGNNDIQVQTWEIGDGHRGTSG